MSRLALKVTQEEPVVIDNNEEDEDSDVDTEDDSSDSDNGDGDDDDDSADTPELISDIPQKQKRASKGHGKKKSNFNILSVQHIHA